MKKRVFNIQTLDDLDGSPNASSVSFYTPDGEQITIDLSPSHMANFRQTIGGIERKLEKYVTAGRVVPAGTPKSSPSPEQMAHTQFVRQWARENDLAVSDRGRIPAEILEAFNEAHEL